ncbi:hypothetical protein JIR001_28780 [Polycladomyces abyssicola]|uniref:Uncharacterized protein n=1 Tax=Polycladomyces abyssicola TaxID=1125966 RepID=A0A8D5UJW4_9BACL|nr:hypothetical protein [Polycladomyces abyssicola]BCU83095.1 hypothetical protein JIR001_28780 [Polycladomyces abyssicola]
MINTMIEPQREVDPEEIQEKIRQCICLELLVALLDEDKPLTRPMHTGWIFAQFMDAVIQTIRDDLSAMREDLQSKGVEILSVTQDTFGRTVKFAVGGQVYEQRYLNESIRVECDDLLRMVLGLK